LFVSTDTDWRSVTDYRSKRSIKSDALFHSTINLLKEKCEFVGTYPIDFYPIRGLKAAREKWMKGDFRFVSLNSHWSLETWRKERAAATHFRKAWKEIKDDPRLAELCRINGVDLSRHIRFSLGLHFLCTLPLAVKYAEMGSQLVQAERPNVFLIKNEYGWRERGYAVIASKKQDIPTVALQHGNIYPRHHGYFYLETEVSREGRVDSPYCPLPDTTLVYGHYYRRLLTEVSAYSKSSIRVTGQPRYDILADSGSLFSRAEYQRAHNIDPSDRILLWTTQSPGLSDEENERTWKAVFRALQQFEDVTLVIKQHPREGSGYTRRILECLRAFDINAVVAPKNSDTYAHLACCDAMLTKYSTTATEAVILDKPVIILNLSGEPDRLDYVRQGVAYGVHEEKAVASTIRQALSNDGRLEENRRRFKEEYLFRCDGRATERVADFLDSLLGGGTA